MIAATAIFILILQWLPTYEISRVQYPFDKEHSSDAIYGTDLKFIYCNTNIIVL